jgi:hypothetical protein
MIDVDRGSPPASFAFGLGDTRFREDLCWIHRSKCYLTEAAITASAMDVDHRIPRSDGGTDAWENLFPADPKANGHRTRRAPSGGYLSPGEGVETRLLQRVELMPTGIQCIFAASDADDQPAANTAAELSRLHHDCGGWSKDLRNAIQAFLTYVLDLAVQQAALTAADPGHAALTAKLRIELSRNAPFTALVRSKLPHLHALFD